MGFKGGAMNASIVIAAALATAGVAAPSAAPSASTDSGLKCDGQALRPRLSRSHYYVYQRARFRCNQKAHGAIKIDLLYKRHGHVHNLGGGTTDFVAKAVKTYTRRGQHGKYG